MIGADSIGSSIQRYGSEKKTTVIQFIYSRKGSRYKKGEKY